MKRLLIGLALVGGAAWLGRRQGPRVRLGEDPRSFVDIALDDVMAFALHQFPREELDPSETRHTDPDYRMQCSELEPFLASASQNIEDAVDSEAFKKDDPSVVGSKVVIGQAWSAVAQPTGCPTLKIQDWIIE